MSDIYVRHTKPSHPHRFGGFFNNPSLLGFHTTSRGTHARPQFPGPANLRQFAARLHAHPVVGGSPADSLQRERHFGGQARLPVQQARENVPRSQPRRADVSVTLQPTSSMLSRINSPGCGGFRIGSVRSLSLILLPVSGSRSGPRPQLRRFGAFDGAMLCP